MASDGRPLRLDDRLRPAEPTLADLLDPVALEERLKEARIRRSEALARRKAPEQGPTAAPAPATPAAEVAPPAVHPPRPALTPPLRAYEPRFTPDPRPPEAELAPDFRPQEPRFAPDLVPPPRPVRAPRSSRRRVGVPLWLTFLAGLALGASVVALVAVVPRVVREPPARSVVGEAPAPSAIPGAPSEAATVTQAPAQPGPPAPGIEAGQPAPLHLPAEDTAALPAAALETAQLAAADDAGAAAALPARVAVHYPPSAAAEAEATAAALTAAGIPTDTVPVPFAISRSNVRFYHAADRSAAASVVGLMPPEADEAPLLRDFTDHPTRPSPGKVEVWLAGIPEDGAAPARAAPPPPTPPPAAPPGAAPPAPVAPVAAPPADLLPQDQAEAVARIIVERAYERLLRGVDD